MMHRLGLLILGWAMLVGLGACVSVQVTPYDLGVALQDRGELPAALEHYKEELALAIEDDVLTRYRLGTLWLQRGQVIEARQQFTRAVELSPNDVKSLYQLALLALQSGDSAQAIYYLQRLTVLIPRDPDIFLRLGKLYLEQGHYTTAALHLWEARDLQPDAPEVERLLLQVYEAILQQQ